MCGIAGYVGDGESVPIAIGALKKLEYRGYDSAGVAIIADGKLRILKNPGKIRDLEPKLDELGATHGTVIAHTRWATHGVPNEPNAHPHSDCRGEIAVIHNGIIENFISLREELIAKGHRFTSETDSEVVPHLIEEELRQGAVDIEEAVRSAARRLRGSFALVVLAGVAPDRIVVVRRDSPLILGRGVNENLVASDIPALLDHTRDVYILEDDDIAVVTKDDIRITKLDGSPVHREILNVTWDVSAAEKGGYPHFMLKEIHEQPKAIKDTLTGRLHEGIVDLSETGIGAEEAMGIDRIAIVACGTAYHAGIVGKIVMEKLLRIPVEVDIASEFRYRAPLIDDRTLAILISQSGETADTIAALRLAHSQGSRTLGITNIRGSTIDRESDHVLNMRAGLEVGVAASKTYNAQLASIYLAAIHLARLRAEGGVGGGADPAVLVRLGKALWELPISVQKAIHNEDVIADLASSLSDRRSFFFIGRGLDYAVSMEAALKLKEISYLHAEAYAAGELKHGPLALISNEVPVIAGFTQTHLYEKMLSNVKEAKARGGFIIGLAKEGDTEVAKSVDHLIEVPRLEGDSDDEWMNLLMPSVAIVPLQLLAYHIADNLGCDIDQPRNLAKSVTVE
jgi:glucosamine--fructose-6-phosphate aminotransferase (isomerizing)